MKSFIVLLVAFASINVSAAYVTEEVCGMFGDSSQVECRKVTYKLRAPSAPVAVKCEYITDAGVVPCPTVYGIPGWLQKLNQAFIDAGFKADTTPPHLDPSNNR